MHFFTPAEDPRDVIAGEATSAKTEFEGAGLRLDFGREGKTKVICRNLVVCGCAEALSKQGN